MNKINIRSPCQAHRVLHHWILAGSSNGKLRVWFCLCNWFWVCDWCGKHGSHETEGEENIVKLHIELERERVENEECRVDSSREL